MRTSHMSRNVLYLATLVVLIAALVSFGSVNAQPTQALTENWRSTDFNFNGKMLAVDGNGNVYALGDNPATNVINIRKQAGANVLWQVTYDDPIYNLSGVWIVVDGGGNVIVLANIVRSSDGQPGGWITLKYDTNGNQLWVNPMPRAFSNAARVLTDAAGHVYVVGTGVLTKYSPTGAVLWQDDSGAVGQPFSMALSLDFARIAIAGKSGPTGLDFRASMYNASDGTRLWTNTTATPYPANDVVFLSNFDYITYFASGKYLPKDPNPNQMAIASFDAAGNSLWVKSYNVGDSAYRIATTFDGLVATGVDSSGYLDWMTIKTDYSGNLQWSQRFDGAKINDETPSMLISANNSIYVTGTGGPNPSSGTVSNLKGVVVKYSLAGAPQWAVWDDLANGKAMHVPTGLDFGMPATVTTLGRGALTLVSYNQTGLMELLPAAPGNLTGAYPSDAVTLSFSDNATNEFWVEVERCAGAGCTNFVRIGQTIGENATSFTDQAVAGGVTYAYRVRAIGFMGASPYSNTVTVAPPSLNPPAAPSNLSSQAVSRSQINLQWTNNSTNQTSVRIERCVGATCTNFTLISTLPGTATTYSDRGLTKDTVYRYRVSAVNSGGASPYSNIASARTLRR